MLSSNENIFEEPIETSLIGYLWKQSKDFVFIVVPLPPFKKGIFEGEERDELEVIISSKHIYAVFSVRGKDNTRKVFVDIDLSVEIEEKESGWSIRNNHIQFELRKADVMDDVQHPFVSPLHIKSDEECKYTICPSNPPMHHEIEQEWFKCIEDDILENHAKFEQLKKERNITKIKVSEKAIEKYEDALDNPEMSEAFHTYKEAADMGHSESRFAFANLCLLEEENPFGIVRSEEKALKYLELASLQNGYSKASFKAGGMYYKGLGTEPNVQVAITFYVAACLQQGDPKAMLQLGHIYEEMFEKEQDSEVSALLLAKARAWYLLSINRGFSNACFSASLLSHKNREKNHPNFAASMELFSLGRIFSEHVDEKKGAIGKLIKIEKVESIEENTDALIIPHWSPRKVLKSKVDSARRWKTGSPKRLVNTQDPVDKLGFKPLTQFSLPNETELLRKQIDRLQTDKLALEESIERLKADHAREVEALKVENERLKIQVKSFKSQSKARTEEYDRISKVRESLSLFQKQELRVAIHHALLSLKIRANTNVDLPSLVDCALEEEVGLDELSSWFKSKTTGR